MLIHFYIQQRDGWNSNSGFVLATTQHKLACCTNPPGCLSCKNRAGDEHMQHSCPEGPELSNSLFLTIQHQTFTMLFTFTLWWPGFFNSTHSGHSRWSYRTDWHLSTSQKKQPCVCIPFTCSSCLSRVCTSKAQVHLGVTPLKPPSHSRITSRPETLTDGTVFLTAPVTHILSAKIKSKRS